MDFTAYNAEIAATVATLPNMILVTVESATDEAAAMVAAEIERRGGFQKVWEERYVGWEI